MSEVVGPELVGNCRDCGATIWNLEDAVCCRHGLRGHVDLVEVRAGVDY